MAITFTFEISDREAQEFKQLLEDLLTEMRKSREQMQIDQAEIDRSRAESRKIKEETEKLKAESRKILDELSEKWLKAA